MWRRYVDNVFAVVKERYLSQVFYLLNSWYLSNKFSLEKEVDGKLLFLDQFGSMTEENKVPSLPEIDFEGQIHNIRFTSFRYAAASSLSFHD